MKKTVLAITFVFTTIFVNAQITKGLEAYYPFNGNANNEIPNSIHGAVNGAILSYDRFGLPNSAYYFDGFDDFIDLGDNYDYIFTGNNKRFTISLWFIIGDTNLPIRAAMNRIEQLISKSSTTTCNEEQREFTIWVGDGYFKFAFHNSLTLTDYWNVVANYPILNNIWYHAVILYDGTINTKGINRVNIYLNNKPRLLSYSKWGGTLGSIQNGTAHLGIGNNLNTYGQSCSPNKFSGRIDDIRFYNRLLSSNEIDTLYHLKPADIQKEEPFSSPEIKFGQNQISLNFTRNGKKDIFLYDISGKLLESYPSIESNSFLIQTGDLPGGVYILKAIYNERAYIIKFIN